MAPLLTRPRPLLFRVGGLDIFYGVLILVSALLAMMLLRSFTPSIQFVERLTIRNPTQYSLEVEATGSRRDGWLGLGTLPREDEKAFEEVIDQGQRWTFRFSYGGQLLGDLVISRADLEEGAWRIAVPPEIGERLRAAGTAPSAFLIVEGALICRVPGEGRVSGGSGRRISRRAVPPPQ